MSILSYITPHLKDTLLKEELKSMVLKKYKYKYYSVMEHWKEDEIEEWVNTMPIELKKIPNDNYFLYLIRSMDHNWELRLGDEVLEVDKWYDRDFHKKHSRDLYFTHFKYSNMKVNVGYLTSGDKESILYFPEMSLSDDLLGLGYHWEMKNNYRFIESNRFNELDVTRYGIRLMNSNNYREMRRNNKKNT